MLRGARTLQFYTLAVKQLFRKQEKEMIQRNRRPNFQSLWRIQSTVAQGAMGARNKVGIGLSYRSASLCSLTTQFQARFLESIPHPTSWQIDFLESIPGLLKRLQIRSLNRSLCHTLLKSKRMVIPYPCSAPCRKCPQWLSQSYCSNLKERERGSGGTRQIFLSMLAGKKVWGAMSDVC